MFVIWNPTAGGGRARRRWDAFAASFPGRVVPTSSRPSGGVGDRAPEPLEAAMTTHPREATSLASAALAPRHRHLGAFGGDGTLHEVVQAILTGGYDDAAITYLPAGSSCDFAKNFPGRDPLSIDGRKPRLVDVIRVDCLAEDGTPLVRYAANYASIGLMADATARFNRAQGI